MQLDKIKFRGFRGGSPPPPSQAPSTSSQTTGPWAGLSPYLEQMYGNAAKLYSQGPQKYTPFSQVANLTPDQLAAINGAQSYANSAGTQQFMNTANQSMNSLISDSNNPYAAVTAQTNPALAGYLNNNNLADVSSGLNRFMYQDVGDPSLQHAIASGQNQAESAFMDASKLVQNGHGFGQNTAANLDAINRDSAIGNSFGQAYDAQNANRLKAIGMADTFNAGRFGMAQNLAQNQGQYSNNSREMGFGAYNNVMNAPTDMLQRLLGYGATLQDQDQANLTDAKARWDFGQAAPMENLGRYAQAIVGSTDNNWGNRYTGRNSSIQQAGKNMWPTYIAAAGQTGGVLAGA